MRNFQLFFLTFQTPLSDLKSECQTVRDSYRKFLILAWAPLSQFHHNLLRNFQLIFSDCFSTIFQSFYIIKNGGVVWEVQVCIVVQFNKDLNSVIISVTSSGNWQMFARQTSLHLFFNFRKILKFVCMKSNISSFEMSVAPYFSDRAREKKKNCLPKFKHKFTFLFVARNAVCRVKIHQNLVFQKIKSCSKFAVLTILFSLFINVKVLFEKECNLRQHQNSS